MKYVEFKGHIYKRLVNEYGFIKRMDKEYVYENEEMIMFFIIQKSSYSNSAMFEIKLSPLDYLESELVEKPITRYSAVIWVTEFLGLNTCYIELDEMTNFEYIDKKIDDFFENIFPNLLTSEDIKNFCIYNNVDIVDKNLAKFWGIDQKNKRRKEQKAKNVKDVEIVS